MPRAESQVGSQQSTTDLKGRVSGTYELLFGREPTTERDVGGSGFLGAEPDEATWSLYFHGLLMTNEFMFID